MTADPELTIAWGASSHRGVRRQLNEDGYLAAGGVFLVADGMGGHDAGEVASATALDALRPLTELPRIEPQHVEALLTVAQERVRAIDTGPAGRGAGTTLTGVVVAYLEDIAYWLFVNVGDSRTYLLSGGRLDQVSVDHSEVQELIDAGVLTRDEARTHPRRNVITRALGSHDEPRADFRYVPVVAHDRVLVCSDGLTGEITDVGIAEILLTRPDPQQAAGALVEAAIAAGGRDNITVIVVDATGVGTSSSGADTLPRGDAGTADDDTLPRDAFPAWRAPDAGSGQEQEAEDGADLSEQGVGEAPAESRGSA
ncbi:protein phosphatase 2C domain-containing protein [Antribacter sp. KLBMP9083]|uniref:Protein phosphatase 2C domain-containing protein n=1 Tax=Antribacter soli TaxID=2910976 RepID=A0AA41QGP8_9MICO|nr:protein phosphatase 2C domain-containing protein [Antribacter soli]MCF4122827.1 protein phosphatase 2C domain-containing protein [Antribacter soli]